MVNAYGLFMMEFRNSSNGKRELAGLSVPDSGRRMGEHWRALSTAAKLDYKTRAANMTVKSKKPKATKKPKRKIAK